MNTEPITLTSPDHDRYFSSRLIPWWDQSRLAQAQVMVVGAGALGNEVLKNLALLGVGRLVAVDFDRIEVGNLAKSVLFREKDSGSLKAEIAARAVRELNPEIRVKGFTCDVRDLGLGIFRRMDVVVGCLDNREARFAVNRACWKVGTPWVDGGLDSLNGAVKVFVPPHGPCYECGLTESDRQIMSLRTSCPGRPAGASVQGLVPTVVTSAAVIAGIQTQEAVKLLHGIPVAPGSGFLYNGVGVRAERIKLAMRPGCDGHRSFSGIVELPGSVRVMTLGRLLGVARDLLGANAYVHLDRQLLLRWVCAGCHAAEWVMRVGGGAMFGGRVCPLCGEHQYPDVSRVISEESVGLDVTLYEAGVPPLDIVTVRADERVAYLEMAGDAGEMFTYEGGQ